MKGWVYVITNVAMPGLVKVGYTTKDPELRAKELNHTGAPHPYVVDYELLIEDPFSIEQRTHGLLSAKREAKEWFRCSPEEAVVAIKHAAGNNIVTETYKTSRTRTGGGFASTTVARQGDCGKTAEGRKGNCKSPCGGGICDS